MPRRNTVLYLLSLLMAAVALSLYFCNRTIERSARGKLFSDVGHVPYNRVGLLLGTAKYLSSGYTNYYYTYRIEAAAQLLKAGKIKYLIISGDNSRHDYNEPELMKQDLVQAGIDSNLIYLDYAGFRTFDSMIRLKEIFSQDSVTVISQQFHNERALFIASREGIAAIGFNAQDVGKSYGWKTSLREKFARVKVFVDYLTAAKPKFLGEKISIP